MVKEANCFVTEYGSAHTTYQGAVEAEKIEKAKAFKKELKEMLGIPDNRCHDGIDYIVSIFFNGICSSKVRKLMDKYNLGNENDSTN